MAKKTKLTGLGSGAFTGNLRKGNPYQSADPGAGIAYDTYEATTAPVILNEEGRPIKLQPYTAGARELARYLEAGDGHTVLDVGAGTGIATLETALRYPQVRAIIGLEKSPGMLYVLLYKFHQVEGGDLLQHVSDPQLLAYWNKFRRQSEPYKNKLGLVLGSIEEPTKEIPPRCADCAIANQVMHWTDLSKSFAQLYKILKNGSRFVWNSASHWFNHPEFPSDRYAFRYNDFMAVVSDQLRKEGIEVADYRELSRPTHTLDSVKEVTSENGFETKMIGTYLLPVDFQNFVRNHVPVFFSTALILPRLENNELAKLSGEEREAIKKERADAVNRAVANSISLKGALDDTKHKYDIIPIFVSERL